MESIGPPKSSTPPRSIMSKRKVVTIMITAIAVVSIIIVSYFLLFPSMGCLCESPLITLNKGMTPTATTWTVTNISSGVSIHKIDVYIQLRNASGLIMDNEPLETASGTHGFLYDSATGATGLQISIDDVFSLSRDYAKNSTIALTPAPSSNITDSQSPYVLLIV